MRTGRRDFMKLGAAAAAYGVVAPFSRSLAAAGKTRPPNVLFLAVDDMNDWIGCLGGHPQAKTPNLDRLASRGVLFERAYCASPACLPSRTALLTGYRPSTSGLTINLNRDSFRSVSPLLEAAVTLPRHFKDNGYHVAGTGKIFHQTCDPDSWSEYYPSKEQQMLPSGYPEHKPLNGMPEAGAWDWGPLERPREKMGDWRTADWVSEQLGKTYDRPFFLGYGSHLPHLPWYAPQAYFDMHPLEGLELPKIDEHDLDDVPPAGRKFAEPEGHHAKILEYGQWAKAVQAYLACITFADDCIGHILDGLASSPHADNTIVVFWSDHGWHLGEKLHWSKFALWEEATRNPFMMMVPGVTQPGGVCRRTVSLMDIYPTLVDLCGLPGRPTLEGEELRPLLQNPSAAWDRPAVTTYKGNNHTVRSERWRYIRYADGSEELYDHDQDELEWTNLAADPKCAELKADLGRWIPEFHPIKPRPKEKKP